MARVQAFLVRMPSGVQYWTVVDGELRVVPVADAYLRHVRFGRDDAESTTKSYAGAVTLFLTWCELTGAEWCTAAERMGSFILWLRHSPSGPHRAGSVVVAGPGAEPVRGPRRINAVLAAVRGFLCFAVDQGEDGAWRLRMLVLVLCRAGLRRSEAVGLHREDIHFLVDSSALGCDFPGSHLHVVRRDNVNGAWAKSRHSRRVPVDHLVVQAYDQYVLERDAVADAAVSRSDFVLSGYPDNTRCLDPGVISNACRSR